MLTGVLSAVIAAVATATPDAAVQSYKWVDAKGTLNYTNTAPKPAAQSQVVEQRASVLGPDPYYAQEVAAMHRREALRAQYEELEWQRRYNALVAQQAYTAYSTPAYSEPYPSYSGYYYPYSYGGLVYNTVRPPRPSHHHHHPQHHRPHPQPHSGMTVRVSSGRR